MPFFPQTGQFFALFSQLAAIIDQASNHLTKIKPTASTAKNKRLAAAVQRLELTGDEYAHLLHHEADRSFITPIDREDIYTLANSLNNVLDYIENVTSGIYLLGIKGNGREFAQYVELIDESTSLIVDLIGHLAHKGKKVSDMKVIIHTLHQLEKKGDELTRTALMNLFLHSKRPIFIIKWKHIYDNLEQVLDACEAVADTVDDIII